MTSVTLLRGFLYTAAIKTKLSFSAHVGKQAWRVTSIDVDVAEHGVGAISCHIINGICIRACKFLQGVATRHRHVSRSFALACENCIVLRLKVFTAWFFGLKEGTANRST